MPATMRCLAGALAIVLSLLASTDVYAGLLEAERLACRALVASLNYRIVGKRRPAQRRSGRC